MSKHKPTFRAVSKLTEKIVNFISEFPEFKFKPREIVTGDLEIFTSDDKVIFNGAECRLLDIYFSPSDYIHFLETNGFVKNGYIDNLGLSILIWVLTHEISHMQQRYIYYTKKDEYRPVYTINMEYANECNTFKILKKHCNDILNEFGIELDIPKLMSMSCYLSRKKDVTDGTFYKVASYKDKLLDILSSYLTVDIRAIDVKMIVIKANHKNGDFDVVYVIINSTDEKYIKQVLSFLSDTIFNDMVWDVKIMYSADDRVLNVTCDELKVKEESSNVAFTVMLDATKVNEYPNFSLAYLRDKGEKGWDTFPTKDKIIKLLKGGR